jgi:hypothetical protein
VCRPLQGQRALFGHRSSRRVDRLPACRKLLADFALTGTAITEIERCCSKSRPSNGVPQSRACVPLVSLRHVTGADLLDGFQMVRPDPESPTLHGDRLRNRVRGDSAPVPRLVVEDGLDNVTLQSCRPCRSRPCVGGHGDASAGWAMQPESRHGPR